MGVNKVIYGGRTVLDISDSTVTPDKVLSGIIGYGADGERFTGTLVIPDLYDTARVVNINLSTSTWTYISDEYKFTNRVVADVSADDQPFVLCISSQDYEIDQFNLMTGLETFDGYVVATCDESLNVDMSLALLIINGASEATMEDIQRAIGRTIVATLPASKWELNGDIYTQSVQVDVAENVVFFADGLFSIDLETAIIEMQELSHVSDILVSNEVLTAIYHNIDGEGPPTVDLQIVLKVFEIKE